jgi:hypothetical protein
LPGRLLLPVLVGRGLKLVVVVIVHLLMLLGSLSLMVLVGRGLLVVVVILLVILLYLLVLACGELLLVAEECSNR